jgi:hypothetical protein
MTPLCLDAYLAFALAFHHLSPIGAEWSYPRDPVCARSVADCRKLAIGANAAFGLTNAPWRAECVPVPSTSRGR